MTSHLPLRILIVDDHPAIREGLTALLNHQEDMEVCGEAVNGEEALYLFRLHQPDVTLMDLHMPLMNGVTATRFLCAEFPFACILAFTVYTDDDAITSVLQAGAKACLPKEGEPTKLLQTIRNLHQTS